jgi:hypothetical protein
MHEQDDVSTVPATGSALVSDDLPLAAALCRDALAPLLDADWDRPANGLEWPCRRTVQHVANALDWYALLLADPTPEQFLSLGLRYVEQSVEEILAIIERRALILARLVASSEPSVRGYHFWGRPDPSGYLAMGCAEILLHTDDIARGFGRDFDGPDALSRRIVERLFPWAPPAPETDGWTLLRWATGRIGLPEHGQVAPDWTWHAPPLAEWDGEVKTRASWATPSRPRSQPAPG